jgi:hypothetical protein
MVARMVARMVVGMLPARCACDIHCNSYTTVPCLPTPPRPGVVLVDSTRKGKTFPDSMSFTVPLWCAVVNGLVFGEPSLHLPPWVPPSVARDAVATVTSWVSQLLCGVLHRGIGAEHF